MKGLLDSQDSGSDDLDFLEETEHALTRHDVPLLLLSQNQIEAIRALGEISKLPQNWDSYGSRPPTGLAIDLVIGVLTKIDDPRLQAARVVPTSGGGVQLEWNNGSQGFQLEVLGEGSAEYLRLDDNRPTEEGSISPTDYDRIRSLLHGTIFQVAERQAA